MEVCPIPDACVRTRENGSADLLTVRLTYVPPPLPIGSRRCYTTSRATPRRRDRRISTSSPSSRQWRATPVNGLKQAINVDLAKLNKAMNDAGIPHIAVRTER